VNLPSLSVLEVAMIEPPGFFPNLTSTPGIGSPAKAAKEVSRVAMSRVILKFFMRRDYFLRLVAFA
jgi:hypothetical protein